MNAKEPLPLDIKLMNGVATALFGVVLLMLLGTALAWVVRMPQFNIRGVTVVGDVAHYNALTLRANVMPRLQGTFFTLDVNAARKVFEAMPWVRQAIVRRDFPNRLKVQLQEHQAVAYWGVEGDASLVNSFGEVFEANLGELEKEDLPRLSGPDGQSAQVLVMLQTLQPVLKPIDMTIVQLELTPRGGWRAQFDSGTELELGGGSTPDLIARVERFVKTATQATSRYNRAIEQLASVDLRHSDGYAIRLNGVSTVDSSLKTAQQSNR
jgi:cell division protein FtsQ